MDNIYITGASGFVGTALRKKLDELGRKYYTIPHEKIDTVKLEKFNTFFFLSSYGNMFDQTDKQKTIKANLLDVMLMMKQARHLDFKSFVYISTSSVKLPVQTLYSKTKKKAEDMLSHYIKQYHLPITIIRPFSVIGVGEQEDHLIPKLISSCVNNEHIDFVGKPKHDFVDVNDVVRGILYLSDRQKKGIYEIGNGKCYSNQHVLELVEKITKSKANITAVESMRPYDTKKWKATKAQWFKTLKPITLEQSIINMVKAHGKT